MDPNQNQNQLLGFSLDAGLSPDGYGYGFDYDAFDHGEFDFQMLLTGAEVGKAQVDNAGVGDGGGVGVRPASPPPPPTWPPPPTSSAPAALALPAPTSTSVAAEVVRRGRAQKTERRGHTKSRRGCYNCKRRRIKCQETRPACNHCVKTGLQCEYPSAPLVVHQPHSQIPLFSLQDMRFFQHFLLDCYPAHPIGNENTWTHEIPCLSHDHDYLMHAILGCSASDLLNRTQQQDLLLPAMTHRFRAIRAIKKRLAEIPRHGTTRDEANAMLATCFALTFQSALLDDGAPEYMAFIRGIVIVGMQIWLKGLSPLFRNLAGDDTETLLAPRMEALPLINPQWSHMAIASLEALAPLCAATGDGGDDGNDGLAAEYHAGLLLWARELLVSSLGAYRQLRKQYGWWMMQPHSRFARLIDMEDQVMVILAAHWVSLQVIMVFVLEVEQEMREKSPTARKQSPPEEMVDLGMGRWLRWLNPRVDRRLRRFNAFPEWVLEQLQRDPTFFGKTH